VKLRLATRKSPLALWQARTAQSLLAAKETTEVELVEVVSSGDRDRSTDLARFGTTGIFTVEVDRCLLAGSADAGVHSLKDMVTTLEEGIELIATLQRGPVEDVLISNTYSRLADLPAGARVATGSMRRKALVARNRPDLEVVGIRGNVDTRLAKLDAGEADALIMARAGIVRLGLERRIKEILDPEEFIPAVGQGIVGITCATGRPAVSREVSQICDEVSWAAALAERAFLKTLRGGCNVPVGAHATLSGDLLELHGIVLATDGSRALEQRLQGSRTDCVEIGRELAERLKRDGASKLLEEARR